MNKIGIGQLAEAVKKSIIENGGGEERANLISETVIKRLYEMGPETTALAQGSNFNANNQFNKDKNTEKNWDKVQRANDVLISSMNHAINTNFRNLVLYFQSEDSGRRAIYETFEFGKVIKIDGDRMVMSGVFNTGNKSSKGSLSYNFKTTEFYKINNYSGKPKTPNIKIVRKPPANAEIVDKFMGYMTEYYNAVERYRNDVYNANDT